MHGCRAAIALQAKSATPPRRPRDRETAGTECGEISEHGPPRHGELFGERADRGAVPGIQQVRQHEEALGSGHLR